jgi:MFS family permease
MAAIDPPVDSRTVEEPAPARWLGLSLPSSLSALSERDFRVVWLGQAVSMTGTWMQAIAQGLLVLELWDSALGLGIVNFANALPSLVVMLFGGVLADRADKRRILIITQVIMMMLAAALGVLVLTDRIEFWMIIVAAVALGVAFGYDMPAYQAFLPDLVPPEKISQVVALNSSTFHGTRMIGPAMAGGIIAAFGLATAYFLNAASFLAVILSLLIVRYRPKPRPETEHMSAIQGLRAGIAHVRGRPHLTALLLLTALNTTLVFPIVAILTPFYVKDVLDAGPVTLGLLWASSGVGSLVGAMALIWWSKEARAARIWAAVVAGPVGLTIMALTREPVVAIAIQTVVSISFSSQLGLIQTMMQESTPAEFRGRVMSLNGIAFNGTTPFAAVGAAGLAAVIGLPAVMLGASVLFILLAVPLLLVVAGGIHHVVRETHREYEELAAQPAPAGHRG